MKRIIALILALVMTMALVACGGDKPTSTPTNPSTPSNPTNPTNPSNPGASMPTDKPAEDPDAWKYGGDLIMGSSNAIATIDIHQANGAMGPVRLLMYVYENLATLDTNGKFYSEICDMEESADGLSVKFTLRERYFSNGEKITMEDIEASIRRNIALANTTQSGFDKLWKGTTMSIEGDTLTFTFETYNINFLNSFCNGSGQYKVMPKEICDKYPWTGGTYDEVTGLTWGATAPLINDVKDVIGSGPYLLTSFTEEEAVLTRSESYQIITEGNEDAVGLAAPRKAYCDTITFSVNLDAASRTAGLMAGDYHIGTLSADMVDTALSMGIVKGNSGTTWTHGIFFNLDASNSDSPIYNVNVRKAIRAVLDVNAVMLSVVGGDQSRVNLDPYAVTKDTPYASTKMEDSGEWNVHDLDKAKAYLAAANYDGTPIKYLTHASGAFYNAAMAVAPMMEAIGLKVELMIVDSGAHSAMRKDPKTGHDIGCWEVQKREDNPVLHSTFVTGTQGWWSSPAKDAAIAVMKATPTNSPESIAAYNDYLDAVIDECPYILFGHPTGLTYYWPEIVFDSVGQTTYYWNCYFDKK